MKTGIGHYHTARQAHRSTPHLALCMFAEEARMRPAQLTNCTHQALARRAAKNDNGLGRWALQGCSHRRWKPAGAKSRRALRKHCRATLSHKQDCNDTEAAPLARTMRCCNMATFICCWAPSRTPRVSQRSACKPNKHVRTNPWRAALQTFPCMSQWCCHCTARGWGTGHSMKTPQMTPCALRCTNQFGNALCCPAELKTRQHPRRGARQKLNRQGGRTQPRCVKTAAAWETSPLRLEPAKANESGR